MIVCDDMTCAKIFELQGLVSRLCSDYERAFLKDVHIKLQQLQAMLDQHLKNLSPGGKAIIDFGFCRVHIKGKLIEY